MDGRTLSYLHHIDSRRRNYLKPRLAELGLSMGMHHILLHLERCGECPQSDVALYHDMDKATASRIVRKLTDMDCIRAVPDPSDRRQTLLSLTQTGRERLLQLHALNDAVEQALFRDFSPAERETLTALLERMDKNSGEIAE